MVESRKIPRQAKVPVTLVYSDAYRIDLPAFILDAFPFDVNKYQKIFNRLSSEGLLERVRLVEPKPLTEEQLALVHTPEYIATMAEPEQAALTLELEAVLALPKELIANVIQRFFLHAAGGTLEAACAAAETGGIAINLGGGFHHAYPDHGSGFCMVADIPIATRYLLQHGSIGRILIVDCDLHQGDGNATILAGDSRVVTFSIHQEDNFPEPKAKSTLDIGLFSEPAVGDTLYLEMLKKHIPRLIKRYQPELVFYLGGTDPYCEDELGGFQLSAEGILQRDLYVVDTVVGQHGLPLVMVLAGGYSARSWELHFNSIRQILVRYAAAPKTQ